MEFSDEQQEAINGIVKERLARERIKYTELETSYKELEAKHNEVSGLYKKAQAEIAELPALKRKQLLMEIADEVKLPKQLLDRLRGETKEELLADALSLSESLGEKKSVPKTPNGSGEAPKTGKQLILDKMAITPMKRG